MGELGGDHRGAGAGGLQRGARLVGFRAGTADMDGDVIAFRRQTQRDGAADAHRAAGDEGDGAGRGGSGIGGSVHAAFMRCK